MDHLRASIEVLSKKEIKAVHAASLEILGDVGVRVPNEELLKRFRGAGCQVAGDTVFIRGDTIERMLAERVRPKSRASRRYASTKNRKIRVDNASQVYVVDYPGNERRYGTLDDVLRGIVLTNALPHIGNALPVVVPSDVPEGLAEIEAYRLGCLYSKKPYCVYFNLRSAPYMLRMGEEMARATGKAKRELGLFYAFGIVSPLRFAEEDLACALLTSKNGWPTSCYSYVVLGATGPVSMAGALALSNAETLACLTLMWLLGDAKSGSDGTVEDPCIIEPGSLHAMFGHPNVTLMDIAHNQMARFYGLGPAGGMAMTDAKLPDFQAGFERGSSAVFKVLSGAGIGPAGIAGSDEGVSFEKMVIENEALSHLEWLTKGIAVDEGTLALDVIREVGVGGFYSDREHTARYLRKEYWPPRLFQSRSWRDWEAGGRTELMERAHAEVERLMREGYPPQPVISEEVSAKLSAIAVEAGKHFAV
jgi:trimethylamine--corrinoid protein Co-methyltransferase